ncbi:S-type pyocin domain-containing protein [Providencia stuartii]|uniref:hypothetical protein n=1 Tax=Providencia stuartii TaxID=588 RepID=UPI0004F6E5D3|nr:hypothetical protein [Providencia stuartii]AIN62298.1 filamentous hemagglutinin family protein [Providencia stuartii]MBG5898274.1 hypothetical protein [Providencia stuartii]MBK1420101.1 hypothetical protein [Providencia stuartii]MTC66304.1 hypothetical protein [Providencia stuartii]QQC54128.1 hypothetical protein I6H97_09520 [Providencia stuartii]
MSQKTESCIICDNYRFWINLQLVDDKGQPLIGVAYTLSERGTGRTLAGSSDTQGLIHAEGMTARPYTLTLEPQSLADALTTLSPPTAIQGKDKSLKDFCREQGYSLSEQHRAGEFNTGLPETVHRMTAGQISRSAHYQQRDEGYQLWFPYDLHRVIAIKRIAEPVFAKSILRGEGNTDAGDAVEDLANFGECDYSAYTCGIPSATEQSESEANWVSSLFSTIGNALNPIGTAQAFPFFGGLGGSMGMGGALSGGVAGAAVGQQENDFGWGTTQQSSSKNISNELEQVLRVSFPVTMDGRKIFFAMVAHYYKGDSLTQQDLLEIADMGGTAPTRLRVGFASTDKTAVAMAAASQLIALHTEPDSDKAQVPVIKGQLASGAERMEVISLPAYQSLSHALSLLAPIEVYRFDVDGGTQLYMGVAASGNIINISARIDDIPKEPIIHAGPSPLPQKVDKPEGFDIHDFDYRPETLPVADDDIVWRHTGHDVEPVDFRDYILMVEKKDVKPVYSSLNEKNSTNKESNISPIEEFMSEQKAKINKKLVKDDYHMNLAQMA